MDYNGPTENSDNALLGRIYIRAHAVHMIEMCAQYMFEHYFSSFIAIIFKENYCLHVYALYCRDGTLKG